MKIKNGEGSIKKARDLVGPPLLRAFVRGVLKEFPKGEQVTLKQATESVLRNIKVRPEYLLAEHDPKLLAQSRERLNREAGVIIANHSSAVDAFCLLDMLDREDVLILANVKELTSSPGYKEFLEARGGKELLLSKTTDPNQLREQLKKIEAHIRSGGLFMIFPNGGNGVEFKDGFRVILETVLKSEDMVYACNINTEDAEPASLRLTGLMSEGLVTKGVSVNHVLSEKTVRIDEQYTRAGEWLAAIRHMDNRKTRNIVLTGHFLSLWNKRPLEQPATKAA